MIRLRMVLQMNAEPWHRRIMEGRGGPLGAPLRASLHAASLGYRLAVSRRNAYYDDPRHVVALSAPVISVGNLTVGGTGKTPMVIELVRRLDRMGRSPAVVARGYAAAGLNGENDEQRLIQSRCPGVVYVAGADRAAAANHAVTNLGADVVILDDGFQHRRLGRNLDLVLIDATCPFGYNRLLPRGLLREPAASLARAHAVVITRCDQVSQDELERIRVRIHEIAGDRPVLRCRHHVTSLHRLDGGVEAADLSGRSVVLLAAIGNPRSFRTTAANLGAAIVGERWRPDHHPYTARDVRLLRRPGLFPAFDHLLTTEKDAVKLMAIPEARELPILVVRIDLAFEDDGSVLLQQRLESAVRAGADRR